MYVYARWTGLSPRVIVTQLSVFNCRLESNIQYVHVLLKIVRNSKSNVKMIFIPCDRRRWRWQRRRRCPLCIKFMIKSSFLWISHQIHFKCATLIHWITPINKWVITSRYILYLSAFLGVFPVFFHLDWFYSIFNFHLFVDFISRYMSNYIQGN